MIMRKLWALAALSLFVTSVAAEDTASPLILPPARRLDFRLVAPRA